MVIKKIILLGIFYSMLNSYADNSSISKFDKKIDSFCSQGACKLGNYDDLFMMVDLKQRLNQLKLQKNELKALVNINKHNYICFEEIYLKYGIINELKSREFLSEFCAEIDENYFKEEFTENVIKNYDTFIKMQNKKMKNLLRNLRNHNGYFYIGDWRLGFENYKILQNELTAEEFINFLIKNQGNYYPLFLFNLYGFNENIFDELFTKYFTEERFFSFTFLLKWFPGYHSNKSFIKLNRKFQFVIDENDNLNLLYPQFCISYDNSLLVDSLIKNYKKLNTEEEHYNFFKDQNSNQKIYMLKEFAWLLYLYHPQILKKLVIEFANNTEIKNENLLLLISNSLSFHKKYDLHAEIEQDVLFAIKNNLLKNTTTDNFIKNLHLFEKFKVDDVKINLLKEVSLQLSDEKKNLVIIFVKTLEKE